MRAILIIVGILFSSTAQAHYLEVFRKMQAHTPSVDSFDAFLARRIEGSSFGISGFMLVTEGWAQAYAGPTYTPTEWLELSISIGGEQTLEGDLGLRYGAGIWIGAGPWSFLTSLEANNSTFTGDDTGLWYDVTGTYTVNEWMQLGLRDRRFVGAGPHLVLTHPTAKVSLWTSWTPIDPEGLAPADPQRFIIGTQVGF